MMKRFVRLPLPSPKALAGVLALAACADPPDLDDVELEVAPAYKAQVKNGTLSITGNNAASSLTLRLGASASILVVDAGDDGTADFTFDRATFERIVIDAGGGDDVITMNEQSGAFTHEEQVTIIGGNGNDTIIGGVGAETIFGGNGHDTVIGRYGADVISLGAGDDTVVWEPGGSNDVIDGGGGNDTLAFTTSNVGETVELSSNADRLRLTRDVAAIAIDAASLETVELRLLGGADRVIVNDLTSAEVARVKIDLASASGGGDAAADAIVVRGTASADTIDIGLAGTVATASGVGTEVQIANGEPALDRLFVDGDATDRVNINGTEGPDALLVYTENGAPVFDGGYGVLVAPNALVGVAVNGLGGDDRIIATGVVAPVVFDGGDGDDELIGGHGTDVLRGGPGNDTIRGGIGIDTISLGAGDDTFVWSPGDSSDVVAGEAGTDTMVFSTSNVGEVIDVRASGSRVHLTRNVGASLTELDGVERLEVHTLGGADTITIHELTGTAVTDVLVDLAGPTGATDAAVDAVVIDNTAGGAAIEVAADGGAVAAIGLGARLRVAGGEPSLDRLVVMANAVTVNGTANADVMQIVSDTTNAALVDGGGFNVLVSGPAMTVRGLGGDDQLRTVGSVVTPLVLDGGDGNDELVGGYGADHLIGGAGDDTVTGGLGADVVELGDGDDTYIWNPGNASDVIDGGAGADRLIFYASNANDPIEVRANGARAMVLRAIGASTTDLGGVERIDLHAFGGADSIVVGDLTGTAVTQVDVELAASAGGAIGDAVQDSVTVLGSANADTITVGVDAGAVVVSGLAALVRIAHPDAIDILAVHGQGGVDTITAAPGVANAITFVAIQD